MSSSDPNAPLPPLDVPGGAQLRRGGRAGWLGRALAVVGGMRPELVDEFPGERRDFVQMAVILFVTALEAFFSGAYALTLAFANPAEPPALGLLVLGGLVWAAVTFIINRALVLGMEMRRGGHAWGPALLGVVLAVLTGTVVSTALVLHVFQPEIEAQIALINSESAGQSAQQLRPFEESVAKAMEEVEKRREELDAARMGHNLEEDAALQAAREAHREATDECTRLQAKATREFRGELPPSEGGSGRAGASDLYRTFQKQADAACQFTDEKAKDIENAQQRVARTPEQTADDVKRTEEALAVAEGNLTRTLEARDQANIRVDRAADGSGLLLRLEAWDRMTHQNPAASLAHYGLLAMLTLIQVLPVIFAFLKRWGAVHTAYELRCRSLDGAHDAPSSNGQENLHV